MTIIEKDEENIKDIETLYTFDLVLFETTVLLIDDIEYCICWIPSLNLYDVSKQNTSHTKIICYKVQNKLSKKQEEYYNLLQGNIIEDENGNTVKCISHSIEYNL